MKKKNWKEHEQRGNSFQIHFGSTFYFIGYSTEPLSASAQLFREKLFCWNFFFFSIWRCTQRSAHRAFGYWLSVKRAYESFRKLCAVILLNNKINSHIRWRQHINLLLCCCSCRLSSFAVSHYLCTQAFVKPVFFFFSRASMMCGMVCIGRCVCVAK